MAIIEFEGLGGDLLKDLVASAHPSYHLVLHEGDSSCEWFQLSELTIID